MRAIAIRPGVLHSTRLDRRHDEMALSTLMRADKKWRAELITRRVPLERFAQALERRPSEIKVIIDSLQ
jgi:glucose 1-dehydrogenase